MHRNESIATGTVPQNNKGRTQRKGHTDTQTDREREQEKTVDELLCFVGSSGSLFVFLRVWPARGCK